jgi:hypothetical protein
VYLQLVPVATEANASSAARREETRCIGMIDDGCGKLVDWMVIIIICAQ